MRRPSGSGTVAFLKEAAAVGAAVAAAFGALVLAPVFGDDRRFIEGAALLRLPFGRFLSEVFSRRYFAATGEGSYQPLATLLHFFTAGRPAAGRALGLSLHAANAGLVTALGRRLGLSDRAALLAGLLFAVFPTHTEMLVVASFQGHVLACLFSLAAILAWAKALETGLRRAAAAAVGFFALALLSKETGLLAPALAAAYTALFARQSRPGLVRHGALSAALLSVCYLWWRFRGLDTPGLAAAVDSRPAVVLGWYAARLAWPLPLCREHVPPSGRPWALGSAAFAACLWAARRRPRALFGLLAVGLGLAPFVAAAARYADSPVADRYLYLPAAGLALALCDLLAEDRRGVVALGVIAGFWLSTAAHRSAQFLDLRGLYQQTTRCAPEHPKAWGVLAAYELDHRDFAGARRDALKALELGPLYPGALGVLESADAALGDEAGARAAADRRDEVARLLSGEPPAGPAAPAGAAPGPSSAPGHRP